MYFMFYTCMAVVVGDAEVAGLSQSLSSKISLIADAVEINKNFTEFYSNIPTSKGYSAMPECCELNATIAIAQNG